MGLLTERSLPGNSRLGVDPLSEPRPVISMGTAIPEPTPHQVAAGWNSDRQSLRGARWYDQAMLDVDPHTSSDAVLPLPPYSLRELVGPTNLSSFDNPFGTLIIPDIPGPAFSSVLDFGCGCGRLARQLMQQRTRPESYLGIDLHRGMIEWCRRHLGPHAKEFTFEHHDVYNISFNPTAPEGRTKLPFPCATDSRSLVIAWSVFTHLVEDQIEYYLAETARVMRPDGYLYSTWFLFDKQSFPMMQEFQNCLYINPADSTNAVIVDRTWLLNSCRDLGLILVAARPPKIRGFQWFLTFRPTGCQAELALPKDESPIGLERPSMVPPGAAVLGLRDDTVPGRQEEL